MQVSRLFEIVYLLLDKRELTAKELAAHFEVSSRTILRDIETLSMAGIPIYTAQGKGGGVRLLDNFVLSKSVLTDREQQDILSALQGLRAVQVPETDKVLSKLGAIFNKSATSWIDIDFSPWDSASGERDKFSILRDAILARRAVQFDYYSYYGQKTSRTVEPLEIVFKEKAWYLSAFCRVRGDYRIFKLSRIKHLVVTDEIFAPRAIRPATGTIAPQNLCTVTLRMDEAAYCRMDAEFAEEKVTENEDGSFTVTTLLPDDEWGYGCILSLGEQAEVLAPEHIRRLIGEKLSHAAKKYE